MQGLKNLDEVAYVRFASVYRNFREARDFGPLLDELTDEPRNRSRADDRHAGRFCVISAPPWRLGRANSARPPKTPPWARWW